MSDLSSSAPVSAARSPPCRCTREYKRRTPALGEIRALSKRRVETLRRRLRVAVAPQCQRFAVERNGLVHPGAQYDEHEEVDLSKLEPLIACPSSPGNVRPVREVAGREIYQSYIGSSANPGVRDFAVAAFIVSGKQVKEGISFDVNPTSRQVLQSLVSLGLLGKLIAAGARVHQTGCNGCIGMGQAPATNRISLRTVPRNFPAAPAPKRIRCICAVRKPLPRRR